MRDGRTAEEVSVVSDSELLDKFVTLDIEVSEKKYFQKGTKCYKFWGVGKKVKQAIKNLVIVN